MFRYQNAGGGGMGGYEAASNLGAAGQNAHAQYGASRNTALTNQAIAMANAYGQLGNAYYNTMGQLGGQYAGLGAMGAMGGGGFNVNGPAGQVAHGSYGGGDGGGFGGALSGLNRISDNAMSRDNNAMSLAKMMDDNFRSYRAATMDRSILGGLNQQMMAGYGQMSGFTPNIMPHNDQMWGSSYYA